MKGREYKDSLNIFKVLPWCKDATNDKQTAPAIKWNCTAECNSVCVVGYTRWLSRRFECLQTPLRWLLKLNSKQDCKWACRCPYVRENRHNRRHEFRFYSLSRLWTELEFADVPVTRWITDNDEFKAMIWRSLCSHVLLLLWFAHCFMTLCSTIVYPFLLTSWNDNIASAQTIRGPSIWSPCVF